MVSLFQKLETAMKQKNLEKFSMESMTWLAKQAALVNRTEAKNELFKFKRVGKPVPGKLYFYLYDPKTKEEMPYYDTAPMGFLVDGARGGFYLLNVHYLSPKQRAVLFDSLLDLKNNPRKTENTKLKLSYDILKGVSKYKWFAPAFKRYLFKQLRSDMVEVPYEYWDKALFLPVQSFKKANNSKVWKDSAEKV